MAVRGGQQLRFDGEGLLMLRAGLLHHDVGRLGTAFGLQSLLQRGFVVGDLARGSGRNKAFQFRQHDMPQNQRARDFKAGIQIDRAEYRFQRVHQKRGFVSSRRFFLRLGPGASIVPVKLLGHVDQMVLADQMRPQL